ncbi:MULTISPECIES: LysR family transcriptional regulator [unclassified Carnobacterium]|uniref:LysR family transcriptional regulator n=1 Tax=unclassified Carnobacterium TaxID=257487 RepID=UPI00257125A2|nr:MULTISPECIES: LysR family transcriptional regulator [unclassified Carnobacterium]
MKLNILQLYYFVNIVDCNFNLSLAAKKIHISQPALSQFISTVERDHEIELFNRKNSRLQGLTTAGKEVYEYAIKILALSDELDHIIHYESLRQKGTIRIGLPSLILETYFAAYFPKLSVENMEIQISISEDGSHALRQKLIKDDLDIAILIEPTLLDEKVYEQHTICFDEMVAFLSQNNPLAKKNCLNWRDLDKYPLATFNSSFMTHQLVSEKLEENHLDSQILFTSSSWSYLMDATQDTDIVTILPRPVEKHLNRDLSTIRKFKDPIPFNFTICRARHEKHEPLKDYIFNQIVSNFAPANT